MVSKAKKEANKRWRKNHPKWFRAWHRNYNKSGHIGICYLCKSQSILTALTIRSTCRWVCFDCYADMKLRHSKSKAFSGNAHRYRRFPRTRPKFGMLSPSNYINR